MSIEADKGMCRHQREKLLGIPQTGACYVCCPWMFPNSKDVVAREAYERWHIKHGQSLPAHRSAPPAEVSPEVRRRRFMQRKWSRDYRARRRAGAA